MFLFNCISLVKQKMKRLSRNSCAAMILVVLCVGLVCKVESGSPGGGNNHPLTGSNSNPSPQQQSGVAFGISNTNCPPGQIFSSVTQQCIRGGSSGGGIGWCTIRNCITRIHFHLILFQISGGINIYSSAVMMNTV